MHYLPKLREIATDRFEGAFGGLVSEVVDMKKHQSTALGRSMPRAHAAESGKIFLKEAVSDINTDRIGSFLTSLEVERGSCDPQCKAGGDAYLCAVPDLGAPRIYGYAATGGDTSLQEGARVAPVEYLEGPGNQERPGAYRPPHAFWTAGLRAVLADVQYGCTSSGNPETSNFDLRLVSPCPAEQRGFLNDRGTPLTRFGVRYLLRKHFDMAAGEGTTLAEKSIHHRSLRHTTAIHLVKAGVDIATISQWLATRG
ncbi:MAG: hypothetical protein EOR30_30485 [Mesorhizobium sp.]|uniref:hypothetical protein n=1 Tax=unclassified Mesorhizobium TaxID=325217 RepID=UPI000FCB8878|nr:MULTISPECIES: hypothetical protein [unclassified Mesorhizobium]RUV95837.1 hypothetical protein EOA49_27040 [Mesorhizobium sp. M1A.F.Ca.IN.020.04.1.1]RUW15550.1 hypothetical protein EOA53_04350 [Mesorhizobium sp. M1A.F.Ca.IN.020.03.1.1]RWF75930.1 MAG: hypothetical protein EOQ34_00405 [Mesorhizobium sp.]RWG17285.1 MAG: hypothetical protein EOQ58_05610 [Mesorhizobium sp.]RWG28884.1 MAG: hypothetical protein EOQ61_19755 [Mesorhizobium sp.]